MIACRDIGHFQFERAPGFEGRHPDEEISVCASHAEEVFPPEGDHDFGIGIGPAENGDQLTPLQDGTVRKKRMKFHRKYPSKENCFQVIYNGRKRKSNIFSLFDLIFSFL